MVNLIVIALVVSGMFYGCSNLRTASIECRKKETKHIITKVGACDEDGLCGIQLDNKFYKTDYHPVEGQEVVLNCDGIIQQR